MEHKGTLRAVKPLLLCSAAIMTVAWQPSFAQERGQLPGGQSPGISQSQSPSAQSPSTAQPSAREDRGQPSVRRERGPSAQDRSQRPGTTGQGTQDTMRPSASEPRAAPDRDRARDAQTPAARDTDRPRQQSRDSDRLRDRQQAQPRESERMQRGQARDADRLQQRGQPRDSERTRTGREATQPRERTTTGAGTREDSRAGDTGRSARLTSEQQTRLSTSIRQANVQPLRNVNFNLSVGSSIPASTRLYPVTPAIVEIYPEYRGYSFVMVEDEIVIIEPRTKRIVEVISSGGGGRAASVSRSSRLKLSDRQREVIRRQVTSTTGSARAAVIDREVVVGDDLPESVEIEAFPETVYREVPEIRSYRYVVRDRDVYVVDPTERRVIDVID